jgi:hypothetical protein
MHQPRCVFVPHSGTDQCEDKPFEFFCAKRVPLQFRRDASGRMRGGKGAQVLGFDRNWLILIVELFADAASDVWPVKPQNVEKVIHHTKTKMPGKINPTGSSSQIAAQKHVYLLHVIPKIIPFDPFYFF